MCIGTSGIYTSETIAIYKRNACTQGANNVSCNTCKVAMVSVDINKSSSTANCIANCSKGPVDETIHCMGLENMQ